MTLAPETLQMTILAAPVAVVALSVLAILLLLFRCWKWALAAGLVALSLNAWTEQIPVHFFRRNVPAVKPAGTLRIFEYNICGKVEYAQLHDSTFLQYIRDVDADILFLPENCVGCCFGLEKMLQELYPYSTHNYEDFGKICHGLSDNTLYSRYPLSNFRSFKVDHHAMLQKRPFLDSMELKVHGEDLLAFQATADVNGTPIDLLHVHLRTNGYDAAREGVDGRRQKVRNIYDRLLFGYAFRATEVDTLAQALRDCPNPLIICGDFNDISGSRSLTTLQECRYENTHHNRRDRLRDAWWSGGMGFGFTYVDQRLLLRLDHILYSKEFELQAVEVPEVPFSDHLPLVADLRLLE